MIGRDFWPSDIFVIEGILQGLTNKAIAQKLGISPYTVRNHIRLMSRRFGLKAWDGARQRVTLARKAIEMEVFAKI